MVFYPNYFDVIVHLTALSEPSALESHIWAEQVATYGVSIWGHLKVGLPSHSSFYPQTTSPIPRSKYLPYELIIWLKAVSY